MLHYEIPHLPILIHISIQKYLPYFLALCLNVSIGPKYVLMQSPFGFFIHQSEERVEFIIKFLLIFQTNKRNMTSAGQTMLLNVRFLQNLSFGLTCISSSESDSSTSNLESTSRSASGTSRSNREKKKRFN